MEAKQESMSASQAEDEWICAHVTTSFWHYLDRRCFKEAAALFAPNGIFVRDGQEYVGHEAIYAELTTAHTADTSQIIRHIVTNHFVTRCPPGRAVVAYSLITYSQSLLPDETIPPMPPPSGIQDCEDEFVRVDGDWKIAVKAKRVPLLRNKV